MSKRVNTAIWDAKYKRWKINVQKNGQRRTFYSSIAGIKGRREANAKADAWLDDGILSEKRQWPHFGRNTLNIIPQMSVQVHPPFSVLRSTAPTTLCPLSALKSSTLLQTSSCKGL